MNEKNNKIIISEERNDVLPLQNQWTTDKYDRKYRHMYIIPFPVCAYAAIYYEGRRLENKIK